MTSGSRTLRDVTLTVTFDRAVWLALRQLVKKYEDEWTDKLSQPGLSPMLKALYRRERERWGGAREQLDALIERVKGRA